jgi:hypothetical protein
MSRNPGRLEPLAPGCRVRDVQHGQDGVIVDFACQYAHPKADPVYSYLIRWDDGQVQAVSEAALDGSHGFEVVED